MNKRNEQVAVLDGLCGIANGEEYLIVMSISSPAEYVAESLRPRMIAS